jgi:hypothetical protein
VKGDRGDYFVRLAPAPGPEHRPPAFDEEQRPATHRRRRRRRFSIRPLHVVGLAVLGWLAWAATTPGGVPARLEAISESIEGLLDDATTDPGLKRAATYYNARYERDGAYPDLTEEEIRNDPDAGWGVGVDVSWCSREAIVLQSMTGRGTISRLLVGGRDLGDVPGEQACPADLTNPLPWEYRD